MKTLALFSDAKVAIPASTSWYLDTLGEFRGKQELYTRQSPQRLKVLRAHAMIESAVSSNRIEGVSMETSRIQSVLVATKPLFRDRDEEEIRGYRDALAWIHDHAADIPVDENALKRMHAMARGQIWDAGQYKEKDGDIIERYADGQERIRFKPTPAREAAAEMGKLIDAWKRCSQERWVPPAVATRATLPAEAQCLTVIADAFCRCANLHLHTGSVPGFHLRLYLRDGACSCRSRHAALLSRHTTFSSSDDPDPRARRLHSPSTGGGPQHRSAHRPCASPRATSSPPSQNHRAKIVGASRETAVCVAVTLLFPTSNLR